MQNIKLGIREERGKEERKRRGLGSEEEEWGELGDGEEPSAVGVGREGGGDECARKDGGKVSKY